MTRLHELIGAVPGPEHTVDPATRGREGMLKDEWLLTTGHGGFAMGCPAGTPHRQYHALLNAAWRPPTGRVQCVHSIDETVRVDQETHPLWWYDFTDAGVRAEQRLPGLAIFRKRPGEAEWVYEAGGVRVIKTVRVGFRANTGAVQYRVVAPRGCVLTLRPNVTLRDMHHAPGETDASRYTHETIDDGGGVRVTAEGRSVALRWDAGTFSEGARLTEHVTYATALARTDKDVYGERLWSPGELEVVCGERETLFMVAYALEPDEPDFALFDTREREEHLHTVVSGMWRATKDMALSEALAPLVHAADDFLVERTVGDRTLRTVIAGYPWFGDWGRDTMIALPGLMITTGRYEDAAACLEMFAAYESEGMIPNVFDEHDEPAYNTVDASLWFLYAVWQLARASGAAPGEGVLEACHAIVDGYRAGTRYGIGVDDDGLVFAGDADTQLTWMDAKRGGVAFSPRSGKCVEINALWVNGLRCVAELAGGEARAEEYRALAERAGAAFNAAFVRDDGLGLFDRLGPQGDGWIGVPEIRPNQLFAVSLAHAPLAERHRRGVVDVCREHLLTREGMRTLSPEDPNYKGRFKGDMMARDGAYHNGTVWPWLIGAYCEAVLKAGGFGMDAKREAAGALRGLLEDMRTGCVGQVCEVYDGDEPRDQEGCCAQAWSVAEALRVLGVVSVE